jgi:hypothetical protein
MSDSVVVILWNNYFTVSVFGWPDPRKARKIQSNCLIQHDQYNKVHLRGTQLPNLSGNSEMRSSLILSLRGPRTITGLAYSNSCCTTGSYDMIDSSRRP